jgi:hypothetical protein
MLKRALVLLMSGLVGLVVACATLEEAKAPAVALFDCTVSAFLPLTGTVERAEEIVRDVQAKRVNVPEFLDAAHATVAEAEALDAALRECLAIAKAGFADAGAE